MKRGLLLLIFGALLAGCAVPSEMAPATNTGAGIGTDQNWGNSLDTRTVVGSAATGGTPAKR